jgi:Uma2 family endonuclease
MVMPAQETEWTAERVRALPDDGRRYEVIDGALFVSPSPRPDHQAVVVRLVIILQQYIDQHELGWLFIAPADLEFSPRDFVQPDVFVVANVGQGRPRTWPEARPVSLIVEVKSESTARIDRLEKRIRYQRERIPDFWIVDPDARLVERWMPDDTRPAIIADLLSWQPRSDVPALSIDLPRLFASALD